eukprot:TRINITY_DN16774_c0_g1_i1.p1 TRINITY_DN16774_c0_g1~~TRINITY_DN16774_c0_g1_i1.p1  ORF type:complete len:257 (-),score=42.32 TRINITY_DN16774_c0_g1_i1:112-882(-)
MCIRDRYQRRVRESTMSCIVECDWHAASTPHRYVFELFRLADRARSRVIDPVEGTWWVVCAQSLRLSRSSRDSLLQAIERCGRAEVRVTNTIVSVGRSSMKVEHTVSMVEGDRELAWIVAVLVATDPVSGKPTPWQAPEELQRMAQPARLLDMPPLRVPQQPAGDNGVQCRFASRPSDLDGLGHVNNCVYVFFYHDGMVQRQDCGWEPTEWTLEYMAPVGPGEWLEIVSECDEQGSLVMSMERAGKLVSRALVSRL